MIQLLPLCFTEFVLALGYLGCTKSEDRIRLLNLKHTHSTVFAGTPLAESVKASYVSHINNVSLANVSPAALRKAEYKLHVWRNECMTWFYATKLLDTLYPINLIPGLI